MTLKPTTFSRVLIAVVAAAALAVAASPGSQAAVKWEGPAFDASKNEISIETLELAGLTSERLFV